MKNKAIKEEIIRLAKKSSLEEIPKNIKTIKKNIKLIEKNTEIYLPMIETANLADTLNSAIFLKQNNLKAVPHIAARSIKNKKELDDYLNNLTTKANVDKCLIVGGGITKPIGEFSSSIDLIRTKLFEKYNFKEISFAAHPRGSFAIKKIDLEKAIIDKNQYALKSNIKISFVTQFEFSSRIIIKWEKHIRKLGNKIPIHVGMPGIVNMSSLIKYSKICGVKNSFRAIASNPLSILKLLLKNFNSKNNGNFNPNKIMFDIANHKIQNKETLIKEIHFFTFGGFNDTILWLNNIKNGKI